MGDFFVWWMEVEPDAASNLRAALDAATHERDVQSYLATNPTSLILHLFGGHGRYVIPQKKQGAEFVPDFVVGHKHSGGFEWQLVELEHPNDRMFTSNGDPTKELNHAIRQISDWRALVDP